MKNQSVKAAPYASTPTNEDSNRTSLTTRAPGTGGKCAAEGGTSETHTYDTADRLNDPGITYDPLGNTTKLSSSDAGGHELTSTYYVDGQVEKQSQNGQENAYYTDPTGRIRKTVAKGTTNLTSISHYAGPGEALSWRDEGEGKYTRPIPGIDGSLCATQANGGTPVLQLHDLQGDVVGTVPLSETETKLQSTYNSTEFGVPVNGPPPTKYSWLGAAGVASELSSGELISGTVAYQPQLGRPLQTQPVTPPGAAVNGAGAQSFTAQLATWYIASSNAQAANTVAAWTAEQEQLKREAEIHAAIGSAEDPNTWKVEGAGELRQLAKEMEEDIEIVKKDLWIFEAFPEPVKAVAGATVAAYEAYMLFTISGVMSYAIAVEKDEATILFPRAYLIEKQTVRIKNIADVINAQEEYFEIIYNANDWYCKNEGVWGPAGSQYDTTWYNCGAAGNWPRKGDFTF